MAMDKYATLLTKQTGAVLEITLNRPEVRNALDEALIADLTNCIDAAAAEGTARTVVLRGAGAAFCAGADLNWMARSAAYSYEENLRDAGALQRMLAAVSHFPGVTLAAVQGAAIGGGAGLAAACDIVVAASDTWFMFSEVRLGLIPAIIAPYVIARIGPGKARSLFVTAERVSADRAESLGLVDQVVPSFDSADAVIQDKLNQIRKVGPRAVAEAKRLIRDIVELDPDQAAELTIERIAQVRCGEEGREGIRAFLEKRSPAFVENVPEKTQQEAQSPGE